MKRIKLSNVIFTRITLASAINTSLGTKVDSDRLNRLAEMATKDIVKFIQNNYRRRKYNSEKDNFESLCKKGGVQCPK